MQYNELKELWGKCKDFSQHASLRDKYPIKKQWRICFFATNKYAIKGLLSTLLYMALEGFFFFYVKLCVRW
jgi:hypothetical protein